MTAVAWFEYLVGAAHNTAEDEAMTERMEAIEALRALNAAVWMDHPEWAVASAETAHAAEVIVAHESAEPDNLLHMVLRWADGGQLRKDGSQVVRLGNRVSLAMELAVSSLLAKGLISPRLFYPTYKGRVQLAEWDALVAGESEPVQPPVSTPSCM